MFSAGAFLVKFSEEDYTSEINATTADFLVTASGSSTESVTVKIIPLTFPKYDVMYPNGSCGPGGDDPAEGRY